MTPRSLAPWLPLALWTCTPLPAASPAPTQAPAKSGHAGKPLAMATPSRLVPEIDKGEWSARFERAGKQLYLLGGMRIAVHGDGRVTRAAERFPGGSINAEELPARLGGGFLFFQSDGQGTRLWRADDWTAALRPLAFLSRSTDEIVAGFDRLYARSRFNSIVALDAHDGSLEPLGPLPDAGAFGPMVFADGWRAIVDTDLRGPVATFDAGATWRSLGIEATPRAALVLDGDPTVYIPDGYYRLGIAGDLQLVEVKGGDEEPSDGADAARGPAKDAEEADAGKSERPLGERPLRAAVERGVLDSATTAVVAHHGRLVRVDLATGVIVGHNPVAFAATEASCQGMPVARGAGFVCGAPQSDTVVYRLLEPLGLAELARFPGARFVSSSGNGALVVRGGCGAEAAPAEGVRNYCLLGVDGKTREIGVRGELGAERVVALADGRTVVLVPPRFGAQGRLNVIDGDKVSSHELVLPDSPRAAAKAAKIGLWLEGFEERGAGAVGGWVEAGGPVVGVEVKLDGKVALGELYDDGGDVLVAGVLALAVGTNEQIAESTDGGSHWKRYDLPQLPEGPGDAKTRGCSAVGCALRGWLRIGWGEPADKGDLEAVAAPEPSSSVPGESEPLRLSCRVPPPDPRADKAGRPEVRPPVNEYTTWAPFRDVPPPTLRKDEVGVDKGTYASPTAAAHAYVWGPKGADWSRAGSWLVRFDDRFDAADGVRSSAVTRSPWSDELSATEAIGGQRYGGYARWHALVDPSGGAALVSICTQGGNGCTSYSVMAGRPIVPIQTASFSRRPTDNGAVKVGEIWYFLIDGGSAGLELWRSDATKGELVHRYRRVTDSEQSALPAVTLVKSALGNELGLLVTVPADEGGAEATGRWVIFPIEPKGGDLEEPIAVQRAEVLGPLRRCLSHDSGWLAEVTPAVEPVVRLSGADGYLGQIELRMRLDPNGSCVEAIAARAGGGFSVEGRDGGAFESGVSGDAVPLAISAQYGPERWGLECRALAP